MELVCLSFTARKQLVAAAQSHNVSQSEFGVWHQDKECPSHSASFFPLFPDRFIPVGVSGRVLGLILAAWGRQGTRENESPAHHRAECEVSSGVLEVFWYLPLVPGLESRTLLFPAQSPTD